jgi:hypothetical protein
MHDSHCWKFFLIKYRCDYTQLSRERVRDSSTNPDSIEARRVQQIVAKRKQILVK